MEGNPTRSDGVVRVELGRGEGERESDSVKTTEIKRNGMVRWTFLQSSLFMLAVWENLPLRNDSFAPELFTHLIPHKAIICCDILRFL